MTLDYTLALTLGLLGSLHCAAMCGPLQLALPLPPGGVGRKIGGRLIYQSGRIATYCLLGLVAGLLGRSVVLAGLQRWLSIALGAAILAGFFAAKRTALSAPVVRLVLRLKNAMAGQWQRRDLRSLALLGALNGLLPCGLVYAAMAGAVAQGTLASGVLFMAAFGLGTTPTMLAISLSGKILPLPWRLKLRAAIPVGVCALAALLILRGMSLGIPYVSPDLSHGQASCCHAP
jgi:sulfite exporter TauE/SafE